MKKVIKTTLFTRHISLMCLVVYDIKLMLCCNFLAESISLTYVYPLF